MERIFQILAVVLAGVAAFFLWKNDTDAVFISAVLACVCFFLGFRFRLKKRITDRENAAGQGESDTAGRN
jgi:hypothetical protein